MKRGSVTILLSTLFYVGFTFVPPTCRAQNLEKIRFPDGTSASLMDMRWLSGTWQATFGENGMILEENWTAPRANMLGAFLRHIKDGKVVELESITFEQHDGAIVQRMRQFDLDFNPTIPSCAEKMASHANDEFVFETTNGCPIKRVVYKYVNGTFYLKLNDGPPIAFHRI
jgi:hypothetical protein